MDSAYGLWAMVGFDTLLVAWGAAGVFHPRSRTDWKALGGFWAFLVAVFTEMYGFPLTVYLLEGPLGAHFPQIRPTFAGGHLWNDLIGWRGTPQLSPFHLASYVLIFGGFWLTAIGWPALWRAARAETLATDGPYSWIRHPQYAGFGLVMAGFLLQWPTIPTLVMFPMLVTVYRRLALREERSQAERFEAEWESYIADVPRFIPRRSRCKAAAAAIWWFVWCRRPQVGHPDRPSKSSGRPATAPNRSSEGPPPTTMPHPDATKMSIAALPECASQLDHPGNGTWPTVEDSVLPTVSEHTRTSKLRP